MRPGKKRELAHVVTFLQGQDEPHKPDNVHKEGDEPVVHNGPT